MATASGRMVFQGRGAGWAVAVLVASVAPALAVVATGRTFAWRDTATLFAPVRELVVEALRAGRLPLWNPYEGFGLPLLAQMIHGALHPLSVAHAWLAPATGIEGLAVAYLAAAALGAWVLARELGCSPAAAAVAGVVYGLSGYVQGLTAVIQYLAAGATAPWAVAGILAAGRGRGAAAGLAAGAAGVAALHLAGDPQWTLAAVGLGLGLAATWGWRAAALGGAAVVLGTGLAAVQLLPSWAYLDQSVRAAGLTDADKVQWALAPARLLELVAPGFFAGRPGVEFSAPVFLWLGGATQSKLSIPFLPSVHVGAVALVLATLGIARSRTGALLAAAAAAFLWLALGPTLGAQQALGGLPIWGSFRYAEKLTGPLTLCIALLGALGADRLVSVPPDRLRRGLLVAAGVVAAGGGVLLLPVLPLGGWGVDESVVARAAGALGRGLLLSSAGLALLGGAVRASASRLAPRSLPAVAAAIVAVTGLAAVPWAIRAGPRLPRAAPVVDAVRDRGLTRVASPLEDVPPANPMGLDSAAFEVMARSRMGLASSNVSSRIDQLSPYTGVLPRSLVALGDTFGPDVWVAMRRLGATHVVHAEPRNPEERAIVEGAIAGGEPVFRDPAWGIRAWRVPHRPYARFADRVSALPTPEASLAAMHAADLAGIGGTVVVGKGRWPSGRGEVLRVARGVDRVEVEAATESDALLVVADAWWPGWRVDVDGRPEELVRADFLLRAVRVPAGRHAVVMAYDPPEVKWGLAVSGGSLAVILAVTAWSWRRKGRPGGPPTPAPPGPRLQVG